MSVKAYYGMVLVAEIPSDAARSSIVIPEHASLGPNRGVVESVGPDVAHLEPGTVVYYCDHDHPKIGDATAIGAGCVMAYEELES